ncbi:hypothetical protein ZWY2020_021346 [Hordeum vulgare]|nr:hypothetical protein ZWY2020_021346 [Hordeum vulgare]
MCDGETSRSAVRPVAGGGGRATAGRTGGRVGRTDDTDDSPRWARPAPASGGRRENDRSRPGYGDGWHRDARCRAGDDGDGHWLDSTRVGGRAGGPGSV